MSSGIILSVREKAKRLPGKVLKPLGGCSVTEFLLRRLQTSRNASCVVLATSVNDRDDVLVDLAKKLGVTYFRGSEDDKLVRYRDTAKEYDLEFLAVVDGDDPFCSVEHIDKIISYASNNTVDYVQYDQLPLGATAFGIRLRALVEVCEKKSEVNTEVWQHLFRDTPAIKTTMLVDDDQRYCRPDIRMTLDYREDYDFFVNVVDYLERVNYEPTFQNIISILEEHPEILDINSGMHEKYELHLAQSKLQP